MRKFSYIQKKKAIREIKSTHENADFMRLLVAGLNHEKSPQLDEIAAKNPTSISEWFCRFIYNDCQNLTYSDQEG